MLVLLILTIFLSYTSHQHSSQMALEENERIFTELLLSIERKYNEVKEMIRTQERTTVTQAELLLNRLEEEITLLRKKHNDLEKLSHTDDHIHFLQVRLGVLTNIIRGLLGKELEYAIFRRLCLISASFCFFPELAVSVRPLRIRRSQQSQRCTLLLL